MANYLLFASSILMAIIQAGSIILFRPPFLFSILAILAFITSLWNHGTTQYLARVCDRLYMVVYITTNTIIIYNAVKDLVHLLVIYSIMASGICCVLVAMYIRKTSKDVDINNPYKINKPGNYYHLYSHLVVMTVHVIMCLKFLEKSLQSDDIMYDVLYLYFLVFCMIFFFFLFWIWDSRCIFNNVLCN